MRRCALNSVSMVVVLLTIGGCTDAINQPSVVTSAMPAAFNIANAPTVEFSVPDMMCPEGCGVAVEGILSKQPGAKDVLVDFENKKAIVAIEPGTFDSDQALAALVDKQFLKSSVVVPAKAWPSDITDAENAKPQAAGAVE